MKKSEQLTKLGKDAYESLCSGDGYIKGYGELVRVMDIDHHAMFNIPKKDIQYLIDNRVIIQDGIVWKLSNDHAKLYAQLLRENKNDKNGRKKQVPRRFN